MQCTFNQLFTVQHIYFVQQDGQCDCVTKLALCSREDRYYLRDANRTDLHRFAALHNVDGGIADGTCP